MPVELRHADDGTPFLVGISSVDEANAASLLLRAHLSEHAPFCEPCAVWRDAGYRAKAGVSYWTCS